MSGKYKSLAKSLDTTAGQANAYFNANGPRKPLRTVQEMADEFGVTRNKLSILIRLNNGPKPELKTGVASQKATWYEPRALRSWWKSMPPEKKAKTE